VILMEKRAHPKFLRPNYGRSSRSRIGRSWRRQRGIDNKKRLKIKYMGASPSIGYGQPSLLRGLHPIGLPEALVQSPSELAGLKGVAVRIASGVGTKKRQEIIRLAQAAGLRVLNKGKGQGKKEAQQQEKKAGTGQPQEKKAQQQEKKAGTEQPAEKKQAQQETAEAQQKSK
jgi:large subunit ribosomal protein L32e